MLGYNDFYTLEHLVNVLLRDKHEQEIQENETALLETKLENMGELELKEALKNGFFEFIKAELTTRGLI
ncbi:hypothetical protein [Helicobacter bilis]|uniref:hypothetical protein n=1 Tax=Helicobacter bilis TaxID=37372 RepID=UPI00051DAA75|nr:hypothetical protein [Helicobacter bilis]TLE07576.1 hypothetical protein LS78_008705 [Helicobacter bilis]